MANPKDITVLEPDIQLPVEQGDEFRVEDSVTMQAEGTHLSTTLKDLQKLHVDAVSLMGGAENEITGAGITNVDLGASGAGALDSAAIGVPSFSGGDVRLNTDLDTLFGASNLTGDAQAFSTAGIDELGINIAGDITGGNLDSLFGNNNTFAGESLGAIHSATGQLAAGGIDEVELNVGGSAHVSDAHAAQLLDAGLSFVEENTITVDAHSTHLSNSLKDLEKLHVDSVGFAAGSLEAHGDEINLNLYSAGDNVASLADVLNASMPTFDVAADVTIDLLNTPESVTSNSGYLYDLANNANMVDGLVAHGIDQLAIHESLSLTDDWLHLSNIQAIHAENSGLSFDIKLAGSHLDAATEYELSKSALSFDDALAQEGFEYYLSDDKFGDLIQSLAESGVNDFVVEKDVVEITDHLASALVDADMLQALPAANLILDASSAYNQLDISGEDAARLSTSLNAMANLGVDGVQVGTANQLYVDLRLPTDDLNAMQDISDLLASLDPANTAKPIAFNDQGEAVNISLILNDETAKFIAGEGGFSADDLVHLKHLGINQIDVLSNDEATTSTKTAVESGLVSSEAASNAEKLLASETPNSAPAAALPEVKVIGVPDPLHDILDPTKLHH